MSAAAGSLVPWQWLGVPLAFSVLLTVLFATPLRVFGLQLPEPVFALWPVFAWAMIRPSVLAPAAVLLLGLFLDLFWGGPMGLWAVSLLSAYGAVLAMRSMMIGQAAPVLWIWFVAITALTLAVGTFITMIKAHAIPSPYILGWQFVATILLFPLSQRLIDRFEDADVRFR